MRLTRILCVPVFLFVISCAPQKDPHTFSNYLEVSVKHLSLDLSIDFDREVFKGSVEIFVNNTNGTNVLVLDTRDLIIENVLLDGETQTTFTLGEVKPGFGQSLSININPATKRVRIFYSTTPQAQAIQWLKSEQTAGKEYPFVYTQNWPIYARSWIPCPDTPALRMTYDATIHVNPGLMAVLSAQNPKEKNDQGIYHFKMNKPIPAYLIALAAGDIQFAPITENTGIYAEPAVLEKALHEFADTGKMMDTAVQLYGRYRWDRFDILVMPPAFPYGGMENPMLTFITPTLLAGDRSLTSTIAHELAHSWAGNLVTNATWNDFWLNEGFSTYIELRILEALYGKQIATMHEQLQYQELRNLIAELGTENPDTRLALDLDKRHPKETTAIAYDKGALFLRALEVAYGREIFDSFLKKYFEKYAFQSISSETFMKYLSKNLLKKTESTGQAVLAYNWVYGTGLPDNHPVPVSAEFEKVNEQRRRYFKGGSVTDLKTAGWQTRHWLHFIRAFPSTVTSQQMAELDKSFAFTKSGNSEIRFAWLMQAIKHNYRPAYPVLEEFLTQIGRGRFIVPLYAALLQTEGGLAQAKNYYAKARNSYHPTIVSSLDKLLN